MKILRKILDLIPHGVGPSPTPLDVSLGLVSIVAFISTLLSIIALPLGFEPLLVFGVLGTALVSGTLLAFCLTIYSRSYALVGRTFQRPLVLVKQSLRIAKKRLKKTGVSEDSEPALLLKEAQELYSQTVVSAKSLNREIRKFEPNYTFMLDSGKASALRVPETLLNELKQLLAIIKPLENFMSVFDQSLARETPKVSEAVGNGALARASGSFQASLDAASERASFDSGARIEIKNMLEDDLTLKRPSVKTRSGAVEAASRAKS